MKGKNRKAKDAFIATVFDISQMEKVSAKHVYDCINGGRIKGVSTVGIRKPIFVIDLRIYEGIQSTNK